MIAAFRARASSSGHVDLSSRDPYAYAASPSRPLDLGFSESAQVAYAAEPLRPGVEIPFAANSTLGAARAQVHENYIVAQTDDSLIIVDQHAAHERLVYEALKTAMAAQPLASQMLLLPEIVDLPADDVARLVSHAGGLARLGLVLEPFGPGAVAVRETPAMLGEVDAPGLIRDLADELADGDTADGLERRLHAIASRMACHGSVRSGRRLRPEEMNALAAPDGGDARFGYLQSWPANLYRAETP